MTVLILGGYGGTGTAFARLLIREMPGWQLIIAGRNLLKAQAFSAELQQQFPGAHVRACYADACAPESLAKAFEGVNMVVLTATVPEQTAQLAEAACAAGADWLDIFVSTAPLETLQSMESAIVRAGRVFVTQGGFHPGLCAPFIRYGSKNFDRYERAIVGMSMNFRLPNAESSREIVMGSYEFHPEVLVGGKWKTATYSDMVQIDFGPRGKKQCFPMDMPEIKPLGDLFGLRDMGVYVSGFNWFVDYIVFSLIYLAGKIRKGLFHRTFEKMLKWGIDVFSPKEPWLRIQLDASGIYQGMPRTTTCFMEHTDAYYFTAACMLACLKQYAEGKLKPGVHLMGLAVEPDELFADLEKWGIKAIG